MTLLQLNLVEVLALSPAFPRQVIRDAQLDFQNHTRIRNVLTNEISYEQVADRCKNGSEYAPDTDIQDIAFSSDGQTLNVTLDTYPDREIATNNNKSRVSPTWSVAYSLHLDVNSVYDSGIDYTNTIQADSNLMSAHGEQKPNPTGVLGKWERSTRESSGIWNTENISGRPDNIDFSINLQSLGYPDKYNLLFTTLSGFNKNGHLCSLQDITHYIPLPPPTFEISTASNPELRPYGEETIEVKVKSLSNVNALLSFLPFQSHNINGTFSPNNITLLPSQTAISRLKIDAAGNASEGLYTIPIRSEISFPSQVKANIYGIALDIANPVSAKINTNLDLAVKILKPIQPHEYLQNFVDQWFTPLTGIYQTIASIIGGISGYILGTLRQKRKKKNTRS
jgi:hypothetical protein